MSPRYSLLYSKAVLLTTALSLGWRLLQRAMGVVWEEFINMGEPHLCNFSTAVPWLLLGSVFPWGSFIHLPISDFELLSSKLSPSKLLPRVHDGSLVTFTVCYSCVVRTMLLWPVPNTILWEPSILLFHFSSNLLIGLAHTSSCCLQHDWLLLSQCIMAAPVMFPQNYPAVCLWVYHCYGLW